jgi:hypothetical protein
MCCLAMNLSGLKKMIERGRYEVPSDRVASALLKNMTVLRVLKSAESETGTIPETERQAGEDVSHPSSD